MSLIDPATIRISLDFLRRLPGFLRKPLKGDEASRILMRRLENRETGFLVKIRQTVFLNKGSPYSRLLKGAGCEFGDLERLVEREGVEGALRALLHAGVYLTVDEFKGRKPVQRGSTRFPITPEMLRNPLASFHVPVRSGGSRSSGTPVLMDLGFIRACAVNSRLVFEARGGLGWTKAIWEVPGAGARFRLLKYCAQGTPPEKWFSQVHPRKAGLASVFTWSERLMRWVSLGALIHMPPPVYAPTHDPLPIVAWLRETLRSKRIPHLFTFPSSAVRLCRRAAEAGLDLTGARFLLGGEPITQARLDTVRRSGAEALPRYGSMECGPIAYGCLKPEESDDMHFQQDLHAIVQAGTEGPRLGVPADALFVTALRPLSPFVLLNVSMGDTAKLRHAQVRLSARAPGLGTPPAHGAELRETDRRGDHFSRHGCNSRSRSCIAPPLRRFARRLSIDRRRGPGR